MENLTGDHVGEKMFKLVEPPKYFEEGGNAIGWLKEAKLYSKLTKIELSIIIEARIKGSAADKWNSKAYMDMEVEERFLNLFKETKNLFQLMEEMRSIKQKENETFDIFYERSEALAEQFMDIKPSVAEIHKNLLLRGAKDSILIEKFAFEPDMPRKKIREVGNRLEESMKLKDIQLNIINKETVNKLEEERSQLQSQINALKKSFAEVTRSSFQRPWIQRPSFQKGTESRNKPVSRDAVQKRNEIKCWGCGKAGHIKRDCPDVECFRCGNSGHMARNCHQNKWRNSNKICDECGNEGHATSNCALRRNFVKRMNVLDEFSDAISTIHEAEPKNSNRLTVLGNAVSHGSME